MYVNDEFYDGFIEVENKWFDKNGYIKEVGLNEFYLFIHLLKNRTDRNTTIFNREYISNIFGGTRTEYCDLALEALNNLVDKNILTMITDIDFNKIKSESLHEAKINIDKVFKNKYFILTFKEIDIIDNYKYRISKPKLLAVYCCIKQRCFDKEKSINIKLKHISKITGINEKTVIKYINVLISLNLLNKTTSFLKEENIKVNNYKLK